MGGKRTGRTDGWWDGVAGKGIRVRPEGGISVGSRMDADLTRLEKWGCKGDKGRSMG